MPHMYPHPREYRKIFLGNYLCIGFVPGGRWWSTSTPLTNAMICLHILLPLVRNQPAWHYQNQPRSPLAPQHHQVANAEANAKPSTFGGVLRGNTIRGNRPERFWEGNLPLRGSLRGPLRGDGFRAFQSLSELFRAFQRFSEVFRGFSKALSETLSECHFPLRVAGRVAP